MTHRITTEAELEFALASLTKADARFGPALSLAGRPPLRKRAGGFAGLASIVVSQQLSTASAKAIWGRLQAAFDPFDPAAILRARTPKLARAALELGFFISVSGIATFKKATDLRATIAEVPLDRLLVETDAPYLAPQPVRGKRNEPAFVVHTAAMLAELKGVSVDRLAETTTANFFRLFAKTKQ